MATVIAHSVISGNEEYRQIQIACRKAVCYTSRMKLKLKQMRKTRKLTQTQVAAIVGVSQSFYAEMESGKKEINLARLEAVAKALSCSPHDLLSDESSPDRDRFIELLGQMTDGQRRLVLDLAESMLGSK